MTRNEFLNNVTTWGELIDFCNDEGCDYCDDIYSEESRDETINDYLVDWARNESWQDLFSRLDNIETGYDYYKEDDYGDWVGLSDDDFDDYKDDVLRWMDDNGYWDEEDEYLEDEEFTDDEEVSDSDGDDSDTPEEAFPVTELISLCILDVTIQQNAAKKKEQEEQEEATRNLAELLPLF